MYVIMFCIISTFCSYSFEQIQKKVSDRVGEGLRYYNSDIGDKISTEQLCEHSTPTSLSIAEIIQNITMIEMSYRQELLNKKEIIERINFTVDNDITTLYEQFISESNLNNNKSKLN